LLQMNGLARRALRACLFWVLGLAALVFIPAWTLDYWQAWLFITVFACASVTITVDLAIQNPRLLESRLRVGPQAEKEPAQKIITLIVFFGFFSMLVFAGLDHRVGWSSVPASVSVMGDALIVLGSLLFFVVLRENPFSTATIRIVESQTIISTGPYARVRHPMYTGMLVFLAGIPLALGSWWGLFAVLAMLPAFIWRLLDEERLLRQRLPGYTGYQREVKYRLLPYIW
jgi:protein-S-isoprenylcysteine O-methyltransferase Ste14